MQAILALGFFDKTATRVLTEEGARGGVNVIFEVKELPIIRDFSLKGLKSVPESDVLKAFRERASGFQGKHLRSGQGPQRDPRPKGTAGRQRTSERDHRRTTRRSFSHFHRYHLRDQRGRSRARGRNQFEGNTVFSDGKLRGAMKYVKEAGLITRFKGQDILDREKLDSTCAWSTTTCARRVIFRRDTANPR